MEKRNNFMFTFYSQNIKIIKRMIETFKDVFENGRKKWSSDDGIVGVGFC